MARWPWRVVCVQLLLLSVLAPSRARAEVELHGGADARTDQRTHPLRVVLGVRRNLVDVSLVLDPFAPADGQHDGDLVVEWRHCATRVALVTGWRTGSIALADGHQWYQSSLLGVTAPLGRWRWLDARFGAELATLWVKHGGDLPTSWIGLDRSIVDRVHLGMFVRIQYATPL